MDGTIAELVASLVTTVGTGVLVGKIVIFGSDEFEAILASVSFPVGICDGTQVSMVHVGVGLWPSGVTLTREATTSSFPVVAEAACGKRKTAMNTTTR